MLPDLPGSTVFHAAGFSVAEGAPPVSQVGVRTTDAGEHALRELARCRGPVFLPDAAASSLIPTAVVHRLGIASALVIPLRGEGGVQGLITARWTRPLRSLDPAILRAVTFFAGQARFTLSRLHAAADRPEGGTWADAAASHGGRRR
jgi:hypothetical protein